MLFGYSRPKGTRTTHPVNQPTNKHKHTHTTFQCMTQCFNLYPTRKTLRTTLVSFFFFLVLFLKNTKTIFTIRFVETLSTRPILHKQKEKLGIVVNHLL